jgi:hypothetical protein
VKEIDATTFCDLVQVTKLAVQPTPSTLRGFDFTWNAGQFSHWYQGDDGVKRWASNDAPVEQATVHP